MNFIHEFLHKNGAKMKNKQKDFKKAEKNSKYLLTNAPKACIIGNVETKHRKRAKFWREL